MASFDDLGERVERLLMRFAELQKTNELLAGKLRAAEQERDNFRQRLNEARQRVDALLARLPDNIPLAPAESQGDTQREGRPA
jgi:cell division protein ZapB